MSQYPAPRYQQQQPALVQQQYPNKAVDLTYFPQLGQDQPVSIFMPDSKPTFHIHQHFYQTATPALAPKKTFKTPSITIAISISIVEFIVLGVMLVSMIIGHGSMPGIAASQQKNSTPIQQPTQQATQTAQHCYGIQPGCNYTVRPNDTLWSIALRAYGDGSAVFRKKIYDKNKKVIGPNPNLIHPGEVLCIPPK